MQTKCQSGEVWWASCEKVWQCRRVPELGLRRGASEEVLYMSGGGPVLWWDLWGRGPPSEHVWMGPGSSYFMFTVTKDIYFATSESSVIDSLFPSQERRDLSVKLFIPSLQLTRDSCGISLSEQLCTRHNNFSIYWIMAGPMLHNHCQTDLYLSGQMLLWGVAVRMMSFPPRHSRRNTANAV